MSAGAPTSLYRSIDWPTESTAIIGRMAREPGDEPIRIGRAGQHRVIAVRRDLVRVREVGGDPRQQFRPIDRVSRRCTG